MSFSRTANTTPYSAMMTPSQIKISHPAKPRIRQYTPALVVKALDAFATAKLNAQRKADAEAAEKARKEAAAFDEPPPAPVAAAPVREVVRVVTFSGAKASGSVKWDYRIVDFDSVPRELLMENKPAITAAIAGLKARGIDIKEAKIAGLEIFEAVKTSIRR